MEEDHLAGDTFNNTVPYLDAVSRARMPEISRSIPNPNIRLCRPSADVFRAHKVNGTCPPYATTVNPMTDCCENRFNTTNLSDLQFLKALKHGYMFTRSPTPSPNLKTALQQIVPEVSNWFDSGQSNVTGMYDPTPPTLTLDTTMDWFSLVLKFYMVLSPTFTIEARDPATNLTSPVLRRDRITLGTMISPALRDTLKNCVQAVGVRDVEDFVGSAGPFVPFPMRCRTYDYQSHQVRGYVDITDVANIVSDPLSGLEGEHRMLFGAVAVVRQDVSWVDTLANMFVAMLRRNDREFFLFRAYTRLVMGNQGQHMGDTKLLPDTSGPIASAVPYRQVVDRVVEMLPNRNLSVVQTIVDDTNQLWNIKWTVSDANSTDILRMTVMKRGQLYMRFDR